MNTAPDYPGCPVTVVEAVAQGRELRPARWGIWDVVIAISLEVVALAIVGGLLEVAGVGSGTAALAATVAGWAALAGWIAFATQRRGNGMRIDMGLRLNWSDARAGVLWGVLALVCGLAVGAAVQALAGSFSSAAGLMLDELLADSSSISVALFLVMAALVAPVVEELTFRGLLFGALRKRGVSTAWTVVITTIAFAVMHLEPVRLPVILVMGAMLGIVRARTGSTGSSIVAHVVANGLQVLGVVFVLVA